MAFIELGSGKVLPDSKTVESCEIKEKDFLVLMVSKVGRRLFFHLTTKPISVPPRTSPRLHRLPRQVRLLQVLHRPPLPPPRPLLPRLLPPPLPPSHNRLMPPFLHPLKPLRRKLRLPSSVRSVATPLS